MKGEVSKICDSSKARIRPGKNNRGVIPKGVIYEVIYKDALNHEHFVGGRNKK